MLSKKEAVNHPSHYGGANSRYEAIKVIEAWDLDFCLGNTVKYISRAGKKDKSSEIEDLEKAEWYLRRKIEALKHKALGERISRGFKKEKLINPTLRHA